MDHSQRTTQGDPTSNVTMAASSLMPNVLFREIHKNAFLKRHSSDRRTGFPRKSEKVWVVFCVHDDVEAFLEIYPDQKLALTHKPEWFASLANALHVSPSICGHEDEFEFAVTLTSQVVRLAAPSWDSMMEWVETIRNKLRELKVLSPKENIYSKMPEQRQPLLPTRDPNSPLPLPPEGPSALLPGVEPVHNATAVSDTNEPSRHQREVLSRNNINHNERRVNSRLDSTSDQPVREISQSLQTSENVTVMEAPNVSNKPRIHLNRAISVPESPHPSSSSSNVTVIEVSSSNRAPHSASECGFFNFSINNDNDTHGEIEIEDVFFTPPVTPRPDVTVSCDASTSVAEAHYEHVFLAPTNDVRPSVAETKVNEVSVMVAGCDLSKINSSQEESLPCTSLSLITSCSGDDVTTQNVLFGHLTASASSSQDNGCISAHTQSKLEKVNIPGLIPRVPAKSAKHVLSNPDPNSQNIVVDSDKSKNAAISSALPAYSQVKKSTKIKIGESSSRSTQEESSSHLVSPIPPRRRVNENQRQESCKQKSEAVPQASSSKVVVESGKKEISSKPKQGNINRSEGVSNNQYRNEISSSSPSTSGSNGSNGRIIVSKKDGMNNHNNNVDVEPLTATVQPAVGVISVEDIPLIGGHQRRRRRSSSSDAGAAPTATPATRGIGGADRIRVTAPVSIAPPLRDTPRGEGERRQTEVRSDAEQNSHINLASQSSARLTLREQQVLQLRREMMHPGGVRLQLRRKDCVGSIALVDVCNGVWVAGWKQKEHPMLYNALHIGDQLVSVGDVVVRSSADAQKLIRSSSSLYIEFIIRRVPFGRVHALQRTSDGQGLGIVQEGNTAEIKDVLPNSIAARQGLSPKTPSCDGLSLTTWFLTEINGRPLNLFFKDNEVRDRLNAVGKEISILVQPHDFIKQIKKHLKSIRSYKDYIVQ